MIDLHNTIRDRVQKARTLAITLGTIIGYVARHVPSKLDDEENYVKVVVSPEVYYNYNFIGKLGIILGAIDIKSLYFVLLRVVGYERFDATTILYSDNSIATISNADEEPGSLITNTILKCEMLTKLDPLSSREPEVADIVIEPQSPVIIPKPDLVEKALNLSNGDLKLGFLDIPGINAKVSINSYDLNYHMIVIGTTGAGKTSFIKNLISVISSRGSNKNRVFILDSTGDYYHIFLPPEVYNNEHEELLGLKLRNFEINIIFPVSLKWVKKYIKNKDIYSITSMYYSLYIKPIIDYLQNKGLKIYSTISKNTIIITNSEWSGKANILPFYFRFKDVKRIIHKLNPYFTEQASHFLKILINRNYNEFKNIDDLINFLLNEDNFDNIKIHRSTKENIIRGLYLLKETGLFDVGVTRYPFSHVLENKNISINIIDLYNSEIDDFSQKILSYYFLDKIFSYREKEMKGGNVGERILIIIDEAHRFFPSSKGSEEDTTYLRRVANKISTLMRIGRRRKVGFIFSTHNPNDLNDIVLQLSNTKVIFRTKPEIAEALGLSKTEAKNLSWERNGVAYLISPWLREGKVKIRIPLPPPIGHYDLSRT